MSKSKENKLVPKLRFPEFKDSGEWEVKEIHKLSEIIKGQQLNKLELSETGTYPCLNGGINPSGYAEKYNSDSDTITISEGGNSCGYVNYMTSKFWLGGHCYKLLPKQGVNKLFYYHLLKHNESRIMKLRVGSGLPNIQQKSLREFKVQYISNPQEQQKIADCLSSLDELITAQSQKIEALKQHKKGLLQGLFPNLNQAEE
jgi:type I restriction enzyme S subunit